MVSEPTLPGLLVCVMLQSSQGHSATPADSPVFSKIFCVGWGKTPPEHQGAQRRVMRLSSKRWMRTKGTSARVCGISRRSTLLIFTPRLVAKPLPLN